MVCAHKLISFLLLLKPYLTWYFQIHTHIDRHIDAHVWAFLVVTFASFCIMCFPYYAYSQIPVSTNLVAGRAGISWNNCPPRLHLIVGHHPSWSRSKLMLLCLLIVLRNFSSVFLKNCWSVKVDYRQIVQFVAIDVYHSLRPLILIVSYRTAVLAFGECLDNCKVLDSPLCGCSCGLDGLSIKTVIGWLWLRCCWFEHITLLTLSI